MKAKEIRAVAAEKCSHATGWLILTTLVDDVISGADIIVGGPYGLGRADVDKRLYEGEEFNFGNLFKKFTQFGRGFVVNLLANIFLFLWSMLCFIPGIIKGYSYSMVFYLMNDNPELSGTDAITASRKLMNGHKWQLFCLELSYIGWYFLCILTCGILSLWVNPRVSMAKYVFYRSLTENKTEE